jgi:hypothetical protein
MIFSRTKITTVKGYRVAPPKLAFGAIWAALKYFLLPMVIILGALDGLLYLYFKQVLGTCYGVLCLL